VAVAGSQTNGGFAAVFCTLQYLLACHHP